MKLKPGVEINHFNKKYVGEIPDGVFESIYGKDSSKREKLELSESKKKPVKDEPKK